MFSNDPNYALTLNWLGHKTTALSITVTLTGQGKCKGQEFPILYEFYGKLSEQAQKYAIEKYKQIYKSQAFAKTVTVKSTNCAPMLVLNVAEGSQVIPAPSDEILAALTNNEPAKVKVNVKLSTENNVEESKTDAQTALVEEVKSVQKEEKRPFNVKDQGHYLMKHGADLAKLIKFVIKEANVNSKDLQSLVGGLQISECSTLVDLCLILAKHFVVYGSGKSRQTILDFLKICLLEMLSAEEKHLFFSQIIQQFLRNPTKNASQKSLIESLSKLQISLDDLI